MTVPGQGVPGAADDHGRRWLGNIDISVGSTVALSAVVMAVTLRRGSARECPCAVVVCLAVASHLRPGERRS